MDVQRLIGEVARRHNVLVDPGDPIFVAVTLNELLVTDYVQNVQAAIARAEVASAAACNEQIERVRQLAEQLVIGAAKNASDQVRAAGTTVRTQLERTIREAL